MIGYLQSKDRFADRLKIGPNKDFISEASDSDIKKLPLVGSFSFIAAHRVLFYRWDGRLHLRIDDKEPIDLSFVTAEWTCREGKARFTLNKNDRKIVEEEYVLSPEIKSLKDDLTAFAEAEDFDFFLFVTNVMRDSQRANMIYRST